MRTRAIAIALCAACGDDGGTMGMIDADPAAPDAAASCQPGPGWDSAPAITGGGIQETAAAAVDGKIVVLGGFNGSAGTVRAVRVYDTTTCAWSDGPDLPRAVHHANAAAVGGTVYVLGSMDGLGFTPVGDVWSWSPVTETSWTSRTAMPSGTERGSAIVGVIGTTIYLAGGLRGGAVTTVSAYDTTTHTWDTALPALPVPRDHGCGGVVAGKLYVTGGRQGTIQSQSNQVYEFTPGASWVMKAPMPTARGGTACGVIGDRIVVVGGEGNAGDPSGVFPQAEVYAPLSDTWQTLAPMITPRHGMGAAVWNDVLHVPGGATAQGFGGSQGTVDTHETLRL